MFIIDNGSYPVLGHKIWKLYSLNTDTKINMLH